MSTSPAMGMVDGQTNVPTRRVALKTKRLALTLSNGMEVRLFNVEAVVSFGRRISARNHSAMLDAEWRSGIPFAELLLGGDVIDLGPIWPQGMKYMEYLAHH